MIQSKLIEHEQALDLDEEKEEENRPLNDMSFAARFRKSSQSDGKSGGERTCFGCGKPGHIQKRCRSTGPECYKCGQRGHLERECRKDSSDRAFFGFKKSMAFTVLKDEEKSSEWILDIGSLVHICNDRSKFQTFESAKIGEKLLEDLASKINSCVER